MNYQKSLLCLTVLSLTMTGCASQTQLLKPPTVPLECLETVKPLPKKSQLPNGVDWEKQVAKQYVEVANNYRCLTDWIEEL